MISIGAAAASPHRIIGNRTRRMKLYIGPSLPEWLPDLTLIDVHVGKQNFDLRLWRDGEKTRWEVLKGDRNAVTARSYASGSSLETCDKTPSVS